MVKEVTIEELKNRLRNIAGNFVRYDDPSIREKEVDEVWEYDVLSEEFAWHDESNHDNIGFAVSCHPLNPTPGYSPVYPSDIWLRRFAVWFRGLSCQITAYQYDSGQLSDDSSGQEHIIMLEGLKDREGPIWVEVFYTSGRW